MSSLFFIVLLAFKARGHLGDIKEARFRFGFWCLPSQTMAVAPACLWLHTETGCAEGLLYNSVSSHSAFFLFPSCVQWQLPVPCLPLMPLSLLFQMQVEGRSIDFIRHNACTAKRAPLRRSQSLQALAELLQQKHREQEEYNAKQKGHVPQ